MSIHFCMFWFLLQTDNKHQVTLLIVHSFDCILVKKQKCLSPYFSWFMPHNLIKVNKGLKSVKDNYSEYNQVTTLPWRLGHTNTGHHSECPLPTSLLAQVCPVWRCVPHEHCRTWPWHSSGEGRWEGHQAGFAVPYQRLPEGLPVYTTGPPPLKSQRRNGLKHTSPWTFTSW